MNPFGLTTIVDLAPRVVLPFSLPAALWLEMTGALVLSVIGVLHASLKGLRPQPRRAAKARRPSGQPRPARVIPLRPTLG